MQVDPLPESCPALSRSLLFQRFCFPKKKKKKKEKKRKESELEMQVSKPSPADVKRMAPSSISLILFTKYY